MFSTLTPNLLDWRFAGLLCAVGVLRVFCPRRYYVLFGALASAALIGLAAPATAVTIAAITLLFVYPFHRLMRYGEAHQWPASIQRMLLPAGVAVLVGFLLLFKIYRYFTVPWLGGPWLSGSVLALIGFSYFIFRVISFLHIQSILKKEPATPLMLLYYTLFPPTITSGPIQKYPDFRQQIETPLPIDAALLKTTAYRVTRGYFRKLVVAGLLNGAVQNLLTVAQPTIWMSGLTILLLYLFFYFDFAGYSDIAIGFGLLLGIKVPENFRKPFGATTVSEFWRNYHITLVDWFRDQVFIPLGGMKGSRLRAALLAGLVMLLCGFWHGLTLSFAAWGLWHGSMLFTEGIMGTKPIPPSLRHGVYYWSRVLWTNARVALGVVFFLPDTAATIRLLKGFTNWGSG